MKNFILCTLALTLTLPAFAEKVAVTEEIIGEILKADALKDARVYISQKLKIERSSALHKTSEVDSGVSRVVKQNILKEEIGKTVRGKILAIEGSLETNYAKNYEEAMAGVKTVYVTFDPACEKKECSFKFRLPGEIKHSASYYGSPAFDLYIVNGDFYSLSSIPDLKDMTISSLKAGRLFKDRRITTNGLVYTAGKKHIELMIDLAELRQITIQKKKYKGF